jgi:ABC-type bacteriocin/lantibiotic exporter with double-glycine peptidase domain
MEIFLFGLTLCATVSGLVTEAVKKTFTAFDQKVGSTALAAICSVIVALAVCVLYILYTNVVITTQVIAAIVVFIILSWIGSTVGYDKVKQAIESFGKKQ